MELIQKGSHEYYKIKEKYEDVINKNITRDKSYSKFIGGLPITLERKDLYTIMSKDLNGNYRYSITQKVDGTRVLLFIYTSEILNVKSKKIAFIDRNNDFYTLKNSSKTLELIENLKMPKLTTLLIDGELVAFNNNNQSISINDKNNIKSYSFMAFDILYGPSSIEFTGPPEDKRLQIGSEASMAGPFGGKLWPYKRRYDILMMLLVPNELNNFRPPLTMNFINNNWFIIEIKPLYYINSLQTTKELYSNPKGFFQTELYNSRKLYYNLINDLRVFHNGNKIEMSSVKLDGLIFTPFNTEYVIGGPWKKYLNIQFKWKPIEEQSMDFSIFRDQNNKILLKIKKSSPATVSITSNDIISNGTIGKFTFEHNSQTFKLNNIGNYEVSTLTEVKKIIKESKNTRAAPIIYLSMYYNNYNRITLQAVEDSKLIDVYMDLSTFTIYKDENATVSENTRQEIFDKNIKNGTIGEFTFDNKINKFKLLKLRPDKTTPNALTTVKNVLNAIRNPVNLEDTKVFFKTSQIKEQTLKKIMSNLTKNQLLRCSIDLNVLQLMSTLNKEQIMKNIDKFKSDNSYEFEIRLGTIESSRFQSNIPMMFYKQIIDILSTNNISFDYNVYHDYFKDSVRSRYLYVNDLKNFRYIDSIEKERVENINIDTNYIYNIDMRFSLSSENKSLLKVENENATFKQEKKRFSFDLGIIRLDCTEINIINKDNTHSNAKFQIELEIIDRTLNTEDIYVKTINLITSILSNIDS